MPGSSIWQRYGVRAWPTLVLIDRPAMRGGGVRRGTRARAGDPDPGVDREHRAGGTLHEGPGPTTKAEGDAPGILSFPGKIAIDPEAGGSRSRTRGHHRIVALRSGGQVQAWPYRGAGFHGWLVRQGRLPSSAGLTFHGGGLYVADTEKPRDPAAGPCRRAGRDDRRNGTPGTRPRQAHDGGALATDLNSPWDLAIQHGDWSLPWRGATRCGRWILPGARWNSSAAPGGSAAGWPAAGGGDESAERIAADEAWLYVADSEASAIRCIDPRQGAGSGPSSEPASSSSAIGTAAARRAAPAPAGRRSPGRPVSTSPTPTTTRSGALPFPPARGDPVRDGTAGGRRGRATAVLRGGGPGGRARATLHRGHQQPSRVRRRPRRRDGHSHSSPRGVAVWGVTQNRHVRRLHHGLPCAATGHHPPGPGEFL